MFPAPGHCTQMRLAAPMPCDERLREAGRGVRSKQKGSGAQVPEPSWKTNPRMRVGGEVAGFWCLNLTNRETHYSKNAWTDAALERGVSASAPIDLLEKSRLLASSGPDLSQFDRIALAGKRRP